MKNFLVRNIKTSTNRFNPEHWDRIPQTGTDLAKSRQLKCLQKQAIISMTGTLYLNVFHHNRTQKQLQYFFLIYCKNLTNFLFWVLSTCLLNQKLIIQLAEVLILVNTIKNSSHNFFLEIL